MSFYKETIFDKIVDWSYGVEWEVVGGIAGAIAVASLFGVGGYHLMKRNDNYNEAYTNLNEVINEQMTIDLSNNDEDFVIETDKIKVTFVGTTTDSIYSSSKEKKNTLDLYGKICHQDTEDKAFVVKYDLPDKSELKSVEQINNLAQKIKSEGACYVRVGNIQELEAGLTNSKLEEFSEALNNVAKLDSNLKSKVMESKPTAFTPIYSTPSITIEDGKYYANLELVGLNCYSKKQANMSAYFFANYSTYRSTGNAYAAGSTGTLAALAYANDKIDTYYNARTLKIEITEDQSLNYTDEEIIELIVDTTIKSPEKVTSSFDHFSDKTNNLIEELNSHTK